MTCSRFWYRLIATSLADTFIWDGWSFGIPLPYFQMLVPVATSRLLVCQCLEAILGNLKVPTYLHMGYYSTPCKYKTTHISCLLIRSLITT